MPRVEIHEYEYGGFEVMGDCGKCGHVRESEVHLNLYHTMGRPGQPEILAGIATTYHFSRMHWNGTARYVRGEHEVYYLPRDIFRRMGQPSHIRVGIDPVHPNGLKVHDGT